MQAHAEAQSTRRKRNLLLLNLSAPPRLRVSIPTSPASAHLPPPPQSPLTSMQAHAEPRRTRRKRNLLLLNLSASPRLRVNSSPYQLRYTFACTPVRTGAGNIEGSLALRLPRPRRKTPDRTEEIFRHPSRRPFPGSKITARTNAVSGQWSDRVITPAWKRPQRTRSGSRPAMPALRHPVVSSISEWTRNQRQQTAQTPRTRQPSRHRRHRPSFNKDFSPGPPKAGYQHHGRHPSLAILPVRQTSARQTPRRQRPLQRSKGQITVAIAPLEPAHSSLAKKTLPIKK